MHVGFTQYNGDRKKGKQKLSEDMTDVLRPQHEGANNTRGSAFYPKN